MTTPRQPLSSFATLGELLKFLRRRARLSQRELSIAVGYSESHISRLETNDRAIDRASLLALFVPALRLQNEPEMVDRLLALCGHRAEAGVGASADDPASLPPQNARLPTQLSSFVGRADELVELGRRLRNPDVRLLTLTGVGGCGKTRLALRLGQELAPLYVDGVYLIELATVTDALLLPQAAALALGLHDPTDRYDFALVSTALRSRHCPLVLDNCEHLLDAAAAFCALLLSASPALQIVATSRERVGIPGEIVFGVQPLALPPLSRRRAPAPRRRGTLRCDPTLCGAGVRNASLIRSDR